MRARHLAPPLGALAVLAGFVALLLAEPGGPGRAALLDDAISAGVGAVAALALGLRAARSRDARRSWALLAAGTGFRALGDLIWTLYEVRGVWNPFPSPADVAYLMFPVLTGLGLLTHPLARRSRQASVRLVVDAALVAGSLFAVSWATTLGAVVHHHQGGTPALLLALAFPITDVMLLTITILVITARPSAKQTGLDLVAAAMTAISVADSLFTFLTVTSGYHSGTLVDLMFVATYLLLLLAACSGDEADLPGGESAPEPSMWNAALPYLLCLLGVTAVIVPVLLRTDPVPLITSAALIGAVLGRQLLTMLENRRLLAQVEERSAQLAHQWLHDPLTGLPNRAAFTDLVTEALAVPGVAPFGVLLLDLDDFKVINDSLGHRIGDTLLLRVTERIQAAIGPEPVLARFGGDEFAVLVPPSPAPGAEDDPDEEYLPLPDPTALADQLLEAFDQPFRLGGRELRVQASIGVVEVDPDAERPRVGELLSRADLAMYSAKQAGRGRRVLYTPDLGETGEQEFVLRHRLADALVEGEITLAFQPILQVDGERLRGFEALARWSDDGRPVRPDVFLPVLRRMGLLGDLDLQVLHSALTTLAEWRREPGYDHLICSVNASDQLLTRADAVDLILEALQLHGLPPEALVIELPEKHLSDSIALDELVARLRMCGIGVALDDFGTAGSSLARLHRIPIDIVKLDRDFLDPGETGTVDEAWVGGIVDLAHRLNMLVVAEGIEYPHQLEMLRRVGCDAVQGFLLGRPVPAEQIRLPSPTSRVPRHRRPVP